MVDCRIVRGLLRDDAAVVPTSGWRLIWSVVGVDLHAHGRRFGLARLAILAQDVDDAECFAGPNQLRPNLFELFPNPLPL